MLAISVFYFLLFIVIFSNCDFIVLFFIHKAHKLYRTRRNFAEYRFFTGVHSSLLSYERPRMAGYRQVPLR